MSGAMIGMLALAIAAAVAPKCPPVTLAVSGAKAFTKAYAAGSPAMRKTSANFAEAYAKACAAGLLKGKPLAPSGRLFLINAPDANIGSIYSTNGRTVFEYWFFTHDRRAHVPSAGQIHEAIYCAATGASAKEQEESGRCLPD
jgi:hypothetical protein